MSAPDHRGLSPLHWAALQLDARSLERLCLNLMDVDLEDHKGGDMANRVSAFSLYSPCTLCGSCVDGALLLVQIPLAITMLMDFFFCI